MLGTQTHLTHHSPLNQTKRHAQKDFLPKHLTNPTTRHRLVTTKAREANMTHTFQVQNVYKVQDDWNTYDNITKQCIKCGGAWQGTKPESVFDYVAVYSLRGELPTTCESVFGDSMHGEQGKQTREFFNITCNCILCEG